MTGAWPGHPRLCPLQHRQSWMAGTRPAMTQWGHEPVILRLLDQTRASTPLPVSAPQAVDGGPAPAMTERAARANRSDLRAPGTSTSIIVPSRYSAVSIGHSSSAPPAQAARPTLTRLPQFDVRGAKVWVSGCSIRPLRNYTH